MKETLSISELVRDFERMNVELFCVARIKGEQKLFAISGNSEHIAGDTLTELRDLILESKGFANHEAIFVGRNPKFKTLFFAFVHNTTRGLSQGGLRMMKYADVESVLNDGLRLSQGMSRKNAVSDLWWGGGKGVIPVTDELIQETFNGDETLEVGSSDQTNRGELFAAYGQFVARMNGLYYTAADIGTYNADMRSILEKNRFVTCIPAELGGSGDPSPHTAEGVFQGIKTARQYITGSNDLTEVPVAVQGAGKVGKPLIAKLVAAGARVTVSEPMLEKEPAVLDEFRKEFPSVNIVSCSAGHENDIFALNVEIIAPCAVGGTVNAETIAMLKPTVKIICGGANNILGDEDLDGEILYQKGITYVPDFTCNWMGIVNCANEPFGYLEEDIELALGNLEPTIRTILQKSDEEGVSHTAAAHALADEKMNEMPPDGLRRNRGQRIIATLLSQPEFQAL